MLTFEQIKELIDLVATHRLSGIEVERSGFRLQVDGYKVAAASASAPIALAAPTQAAPIQAVPTQAAPAQAAPSPHPVTVAQAPASDPSNKPPTAAEPAVDAHVATSPMVGTFYRSANPEAPPFAEVGSRVEKGQVLCIIEAMKLMNEIESEVDGVVVEVYTKNEQPVEFGEPLFAIKTD